MCPLGTSDLLTPHSVFYSGKVFLINRGEICMQNPPFVYLCCHFLYIFHILEFFGIFWHILGKICIFPKISEILSFQHISRIRNLVYLWKALFKWVKYFEVKYTENDCIFNCIFSAFWEHICIHISSVFNAYIFPL